MGLSLVCHEHIYQAIKEEHQVHNYPIATLCKLGKVSRAAYYKWLHRELPASEQKNRLIADKIKKIHIESPDKGYRRIKDDLECYHDIDVKSKWNPKYPNAMKSWESNWDVLSPMFKFSKEVRTLIYTTNAIESLNSTYKKLNR